MKAHTMLIWGKSRRVPLMYVILGFFSTFKDTLYIVCLWTYRYASHLSCFKRSTLSSTEQRIQILLKCMLNVLLRYFNLQVWASSTREFHRYYRVLLKWNLLIIRVFDYIRESIHCNNTYCYSAGIFLFAMTTISSWYNAVCSCIQLKR